MAGLPSQLRTGLLDEGDERVDDTLETFAALMRVFAKDALVVAGKITAADGRREVRAVDMKHAMMYCARTFFEQQDGDLRARVEQEIEKMQDEESGDGESGEEGEQSGEEESEEESAEDGACVDGPWHDVPLEERASYESLGKHVRAIVDTWHLWAPTDPVHVLIKRAIDATAA